jgi:hypothetical protein
VASEDRILTANEVAERLKVSGAAVRARMNKGEIPGAFRQPSPGGNGAWRIPEFQFERWMHERQLEAVARAELGDEEYERRQAAARAAGDAAFAQREAEERERRERMLGVVGGYGDDELLQRMQATHGQEATEQLAQVLQRHTVLAQLDAVLRDKPDLARAFAEADDEVAVERAAQALAERVRWSERVRRRANEILDDEDEEG